MRRLFKLLIATLALMMLVGCGKDNTTSKENTGNSAQEQTEITESIPESDPAYWTMRGSELTGYVTVPYSWTEDEYEYELEEQYSLMLISPQRNAMVSLVKNNYGFDPNMYDSQSPEEYILKSYLAQYEAQGGQNLELGELCMGGYTFCRSLDCYPAGVYEDYDYYIYTYVAYTGDRFYTIVVEGDKMAIEQIVTKVEESFSPIDNKEE